MGAEAHINREEVFTGICRMWEKEKGYHCRPKILCLDAAKGEAAIGQSSSERDFLNGMLRCHFKPRRLITPSEEEKKESLRQLFNKKSLLGVLGGCSRNVLTKRLEYISKVQHLAVYRAVALGFFATIKYKEISAEPLKKELLAA